MFKPLAKVAIEMSIIYKINLGLNQKYNYKSMEVCSEHGSAVIIR